jgi:hypothetical protein
MQSAAVCRTETRVTSVDALVAKRFFAMCGHDQVFSPRADAAPCQGVVRAPVESHAITFHHPIDERCIEKDVTSLLASSTSTIG